MITGCLDSTKSSTAGPAPAPVSAGSSGSVTAPGTTLPKLSRTLARELPLDSTFTLEAIRDLPGGAVEIRALSAWDTLRTSTFMLDSLSSLGYETADNPSRILEGVLYSKKSGKIQELFIQITLKNDKSCRVILRTTAKDA